VHSPSYGYGYTLLMHWMQAPQQPTTNNTATLGSLQHLTTYHSDEGRVRDMQMMRSTASQYNTNFQTDYINWN